MSLEDSAEQLTKLAELAEETCGYLENAAHSAHRLSLILDKLAQAAWQKIDEEQES